LAPCTYGQPWEKGYDCRLPQIGLDWQDTAKFPHNDGNESAATVEPRKKCLEKKKTPA